jgi:hypothetical protein
MSAEYQTPHWLEFVAALVFSNVYIPYLTSGSWHSSKDNHTWSVYVEQSSNKGIYTSALV